MLSSPHLQANEERTQTYGRWWNPLECVHVLTSTNMKRHIRSRRGAWAFIRAGADLRGMKCVQHSVSLPANLVRMMSAGAGMNKLRLTWWWVLTFKGEMRRMRRRDSESCVGGGVTRTHGQRSACMRLSLRNAKARRWRPHWEAKRYHHH